jgi:hypothetical protein
MRTINIAEYTSVSGGNWEYDVEAGWVEKVVTVVAGAVAVPVLNAIKEIWSNSTSEPIYGGRNGVIMDLYMQQWGANSEWTSDALAGP